MTLGTIIVTYNSALWVERAVRSLFGSKGRFKHRLVVVDNGSRDDTLAVLKRLQKKYKFEIVKNENLGFSAGVNVGLKALGFRPAFSYQLSAVSFSDRPDAVLLLNPDAALTPNALGVLVSRLRGHVGIVAPKMVFPDGTPQSSNFGIFPNWRTQLVNFFKLHKLKPWGHYVLPQTVGAGFFIKERPVPWVSGGAMLLRREVMERVGAWDQNYFLYVEDIDYCCRARLAGFDVRYIPSAVAYHRLGHATNPNPVARNLKPGTNNFIQIIRLRIQDTGYRIQARAKDWERESLQYYFRKYSGRKPKLYYAVTDLNREPAGLRRLDFIVEMLNQEFGKIEGLRILDVGAGHGNTSAALAYLGAKVTAVENDPATLITLTERGREMGFKVVAADAQKFKTQTKFDAIVATEILEHFKRPVEVAGQLKLLLQGRGVMIVSVPNGAGLEERLRRFGHRWWLGRRLKKLVQARARQSSDIQSGAQSPHQVYYGFDEWQKSWSKAGFSVKRVASQSVGFKSFFYVFGRLGLRREQPWFGRLDRWDAFWAKHTRPRWGDGFMFVLKPERLEQ